MKHTGIKNFILIIVTISVAAASIWLPGFLMQKNNKKTYESINDVPHEYYSGPSEAIIKNASKQLSREERIRLITGVWESRANTATADECSITEFGIKTLTENRVRDLYIKGLYPKNLMSDYNNWYAWSATPYKALDTTFKTYAAIYWDLTFTKYDNSEVHRFIVTENGDILYAEMNTKKEEEKSLSNFSPRLSNISYLFYDFGNVTSTTYNSGSSRIVYTPSETIAFSTKYVEHPDEDLLLLLDKVHNFISGTSDVHPDDIYELGQSTNSTVAAKYLVASQKTDNSFRIVMIPEQ